MFLYEPNLIEIKLYYTVIKIQGENKKLVVLDDTKAEKMIADTTNKNEVLTFITRWSMLNWQEQNVILAKSSMRSNNKGETLWDGNVYRDAVVKSSLKEWDLKYPNGSLVPVTPEAIDKLPSDVIIALYNKYIKITEITEDELKN